MLKPITLNELSNAENVEIIGDKIYIVIPPDWIVLGETRLSYTTILRIVECSREHHWNIDILSRAKTPLDSITRCLECEFFAPILVGSKVIIRYAVIGHRRKSYKIRFEIVDEIRNKVCATIKMISVFYDPAENISVEPPTAVSEFLQKTLTTEISND